MEGAKGSIYPAIDISLPISSQRLWAFPLLGGAIKIIILIPMLFILLALSLASGFLTSLVNSFIVLFTGNYWETAYSINVMLITFQTKIWFYFTGITDKYPSFDHTEGGAFSISIPKPSNPNRFFAFPLLGGLIRYIILLPFLVYQYILLYSHFTAIVFAAIKVLFEGKYPESSFEFVRDTIRVTQASSMYLLGLSDKYPSFSISMKHQTAKIIFLILGTLLIILNFANNGSHNQKAQSQSSSSYTNSY